MDEDTLPVPRPANHQLGTVQVIGAGTFWSTILLVDNDYFNALIEQADYYALLVFFISMLIPFFERSYWRCLGVIPYALTLIVIIAGITVATGQSNTWHFAILAACYGLVLGAACRWFYQPHLHNLKQIKRVPLNLKRNEIIHRKSEPFDRLILLILGINILIVLVIRVIVGPPFINSNSWMLICTYQFFAISIFLTILSWLRLKRHAYEVWVESWARILYKIREKGPGVDSMPFDGPLIIVANHACWWDPLFIAGNIRRPVTPMMTSGFYDIWHLRPFMQHVIKAIRVPDKPVRHETPELHEAIAALDRGECLVIFPEGYLRRKEEIPLRRFGRGIHEILKVRPDTPVVAAWIEGGWGSWCSYKDGPPTKNKRIDFRRRIDVGFSSPIVVPAEVLENHWPTRVFLMNAVSGARRHLGLEPLPEFRVTTSEAVEEATP